ncbi:MAG: hypothetical protein QXP43_06785 [Nitrososphaerota archaeon]
MIPSELGASIAMLLASALAFVNGVEALGERLGLTRFATGSLLAAALTALPELIIAVVSPFHEAAAAREVGITSVVAAPSITLLIGAPIVGLFLKDPETPRKVSRTYLRFSVLMLPALLTPFLSSPAFLFALGSFYLLAFVLVGRSILREPGELMEAEASYLERLAGRRSTALVALQTASSSLLMVWAADAFLDSVVVTGNPLAYGLLLSPLATCLPEVLVAFLWTARGNASMGLSLLSGENVLQSSLVIGLGLVATGSAVPAEELWAVALYSAFGALYAVLLRRHSARLLVVGIAGYALYLLIGASLL